MKFSPNGKRIIYSAQYPVIEGLEKFRHQKGIFLADARSGEKILIGSGDRAAWISNDEFIIY